MAHNTRYSKHRLLALLATVALALGAAACGDSDDDNGGAAAQGQSQNGDQAPVDNSPEGQIRATYAKYTDTFYTKDPEAICAMLGQKAQRQWAGKTDKTCEAGIKRFFGAGATLGKNRPYLVKIRINGQQALATAKTKTSNTYPVPMVKENGEWKINIGGAG